MIIKQLILNALQRAGKGGGIGGFIASAVIAAVQHAGGLAGSGPKRLVDPSWFGNGARRYHEGGIAGLRPGEIPAILKKGEEILTENDPRHVLNGGAKQARGDITIQNFIDSGEFFSSGLNTRDGETAIMNFVTARRSAMRAALGV